MKGGELDAETTRKGGQGFIIVSRDREGSLGQQRLGLGGKFSSIEGLETFHMGGLGDTASSASLDLESVAVELFNQGEGPRRWLRSLL